MARLGRIAAASALTLAAVSTVLGGVPASADALPVVQPRTETAPNFDDDPGGNADADDPAIWVHPTNPDRSVVVGTLKNGGLTVVGLNGRQLQHIAAPPAGRFNNVDIIQGARFADRVLDIAVVTDRGRDRLRVYGIDPRGADAGSAVLTDITTASPRLLFSASEAEVEEQRTGYGTTVWPDPAGGAPFVVVSRRHETRLAVFRMRSDSTGKIGYVPSAQIDLPATFTVGGAEWTPCAEPGERPQVEGMVVDGVANVLYAAQEDVGVWRIPLQAGGFGTPELVERVREFGQPATYDATKEECVPTGPPAAEAGTRLSADAEGLTVAYNGDGTRTLVASSQGDSTFSAFAITDTGITATGRFRVGRGYRIDGVQHSDGAAVTTAPLGRAFPNGLLVVHDGENTPAVSDGGETRPNTNFKFVRWDEVTCVLGS
ncbi:3-phytase [Herbihabitans rhizosphaerae]|uniref:3-phytase n=1 Tax=Herbihabitans rhizosphaerae TaxID=1872711 RepID=A0A4Q7L497_9PSEU|nr:phytase [Herbihabitans rhizosphaerae]RZS43311.1 3-phytase [Herbihabitans rhizosphaerae]